MIVSFMSGRTLTARYWKLTGQTFDSRVRDWTRVWSFTSWRPARSLAGSPRSSRRSLAILPDPALAPRRRQVA